MASQSGFYFIETCRNMGIGNGNHTLLEHLISLQNYGNINKHIGNNPFCCFKNAIECMLLLYNRSVLESAYGLKRWQVSLCVIELLSITL